MSNIGGENLEIARGNRLLVFRLYMFSLQIDYMYNIFHTLF